MASMDLAADTLAGEKLDAELDELIGDLVISGTGVEGAVESLTCWGSTGWVWNPARPEEVACIEAVIGGTVIGRTTAHQMRQDIALSGRGTGQYGFTLTFDRPLASSFPPVLRAVFQSSTVVLPAPAVSAVEGYVDRLTRWGAIGWAWTPEAPDAHLEVQVVLGDIVIARATANETRMDIARSRRGTGRYGFTLTFARPLEGGELPIVRVIGPRGPVVLEGSHWSPVEGFVDSLTHLGAIGWAWMPGAPEQAVVVEALLGGKSVGRAVADQLRQDMVQSGRGTGRYGFSLAFHEPLQGTVPPLLRVVLGDSTFLLPGAERFPAEEAQEPVQVIAPQFEPKEATEASSLAVEGHVDYMSRWGAMGWAWFPSTPDAAAQIEAVLEGHVVGRTLADQMRPDLADGGRGTGRYGFVLGFDEPLAGNKAPLVRVLGPEGPTVLPGADELPPPEAVADEKPSKPQSANFDWADDSPSPDIEGSVDVLSRSGARGWAWMPSAPGISLRVEAVLDGRVIGRTSANEMRPDLLGHNKGTGLYGFKMSFEERLTGDKAPSFQVLSPLREKLPGVETFTHEDTARRPRGTLASLLADHTRFTANGPEFEEFDPGIFAQANLSRDTPSPLLIAFYLPQFHPIPENDAFWGKGFTEWRQLPRGSSRFPGHYQPRTPRDLGFYHLGSVDSLREQAALARAAGVGAFGFYYYWFNRKRVLEKPLDLLLTSDVEMPFFIIWANENWTRTWDGSDSQVLLRQDYNTEDEDPLLEDLARHFLDRRYVRLEGRPLFVIYNPKNIPDSAATIARWRDILLSRYGVSPLIFMAQTFGERDPRTYALDGALEFPPHKLADKLPGRETTDAYSEEFAGHVVAYEEFVKASLGEEDTDFPLVKTIVPSWDNEARRPNRAFTLEGSSPAKYEAWLRKLIVRAMDNPTFGTPIVAINAWNEWAEGAYLEPDVYFGSAFLNATARGYVAAINDYFAGTDAAEYPDGRRPAVSVILPNYNHSRFIEERILSVIEQDSPPDEIIFLDDCSSDDSVSKARVLLAKSGIPHQIVLNKTNSGCVFKQWIKGITLARNDLIWIAETDDSADRSFLSHVLSAFLRDDVLASFGRITCIDENGAARTDLDGYFDDLNDFSWHASRVVPAYKAFSHDFAVKNVIPNASGLVFRKPSLSDAELNRLFQYRFAGDWYFYALVLRGGSVAYSRRARSFFRVNQSSTSRSAFFTERHLQEHKMIVEDLWEQYGISEQVVDAHADALSIHFKAKPAAEIRDLLRPPPLPRDFPRPMRICVAADGFAVGGGEVLPLELANAMRGGGCHITYLAMQRDNCQEREKSIRPRLRSDIPVFYWDDVSTRFPEFLVEHGIEIINSHNVSVDYRLFCLGTRLSVPYVASLHGGYETVPDLLKPDFIRFLNDTVTSWLFLADKNTRILKENGVEKGAFHQSFNAVAEYRGEWVDRSLFRKEHNIPDDAFVLVLCSRAIREKGWQVAIDVVRAVRLSRMHGRDVRLVLIGDGPFLAEIKSIERELGYVTFLGHVDSPIRFLRCFDMGIFPSTFSGETFPLFLLECFQAGIPLLSTDIGEIARIMGSVEARRPGKTVSHRAAAAEIRSNMVEILLSVLTEPRTYSRMCANARRASEKFSMQLLADFYDSVFRKCITPAL